VPDRNGIRWSNCRLSQWRVDAAVSRFRSFERMLDCRDRLANRARLGNAFARALAFLLISQILNDRQPSRFSPAPTAAPGAPEVKAAAFARYFATVNIDPREGAVMWNLCCLGIIAHRESGRSPGLGLMKNPSQIRQEQRQAGWQKTRQSRTKKGRGNSNPA